MKLQIPPKVARILDTLDAHDYEAYAVGGCIRDTILARTPDDWDITTSAKPEEVKALFRRTVDTGLQHGTVTVLLDEESFEVTTYRIDGEYEDHRHPAEVKYASKLSEDLMRRDFTINAMAYNKKTGLVDLFEGMEDLQRKVVRCVGNPTERFSEDALRILRAVRFSAQLGFSIEQKTLNALISLAPTLVHVSKERIQVELVKLLVSDNPQYVKLLEETGILKVILPELPVLEEDTQRHLMQLPREKAICLAALLLPLGAKGTKKVLRELKFDNHTISTAEKLVKWYERDIEPDELSMRLALNEIGEEMMKLLLLFQEFRHPVEELQKIYQQVLDKGQCYQLKQLEITGSDLISLGMKPGRQIGQILQTCLQLVLREPEKNTKKYLQDYVEKFIE